MCEFYDGPEHLRYRCTHGSRNVGSSSNPISGNEALGSGSYSLENKIRGNY